MKKVSGDKMISDSTSEALPWITALRILGLAHSHFQRVRSVGLGQLILKYQSGECKITQIETDPPTTNTYRVQMFGSGVTVVDKESQGMAFTI